MKHIELINRFRTDLSRLVVEVEASVAMNQLDINKICEDVVCGLLREIYGFEALRNLNSEEIENYPGIDLADDEARVAIQVTSDKSLDKVKETLGKVIKHGLTDKYDRIIIYNLTRKQRSYSESAISAVCGDKISFDASSDILDFTDISEKAGTLTPTKLQAASDHLFAYMHGSEARASGNQGDIDKLTVSTPDPALADEKILHQLQLLRISRQFAEFDRLGEARRLAESCTSGQLSSGSSFLRSRALAWCSRILSNDDPAEAERVLDAARALSREPEIDIAEAFLISKLDGRNPALSTLASKNSPQAASAALFIVSNHDGKAQALEWFRETGIGPNELDADGKNLLLDLQLEQGDWSGAAVTAGFCSDADCEDPIWELVNIIRTENPEAGNDGFSDLSRYFVLADSELSRLGVLRDAPYFYRRAASFAQATLIQRQINVVGADPTDFRKWIDEHFSPQFYAQSLVDMRLAPRWHPELIHAVQLKQEFIGRIMGAAEANKERLGDGRLAALLRPTTEHEGSLVSAAKFPRPYFPGPLEGDFPPPQGLPEVANEVIDEQLSLPDLTTKSFIASANLANMYAIEEELASRISERLKSGKYHFQGTQSDEEFAAVLSGLAVLAAVTRSQELANDVRILVRKYRRDPAHKISMTTACRTVFFAAAANQGLEGWCGYIGDAVEELALGALTRDEAGILQSLIRRTCEAEPVLWTSIGAAEAALSTYLGS